MEFFYLWKFNEPGQSNCDYRGRYMNGFVAKAVNKLKEQMNL